MIARLFETAAAMAGKFDEAEAAVRYIRAGKATITLRSEATGTRFTYEIEQAELPDQTKVHWVRVLTGGDNEGDFTYLGMLNARGRFCATKKTPDALKGAVSFKAFDWSWRQLAEQKTMPTALEVWHEGACGRCGRKLTVPESIADGLGPECRKKARG